MTGRRSVAGMTLSEVALVFVVIGLVLSAIWTATASVYSNYRTSLATKRLLQIVHNVHSLYGMGPGRMIGMDIQGAAGAVVLAAAGVFPHDMLDGNSPPQHVTNSWGGAVTMDALHVDVDGDAFQVGFEKVPRSICANLIVRMTGAQKDPSLIAAGTETKAFPFDDMPVGASDAALACPTALNKVVFSFRLKT